MTIEENVALAPFTTFKIGGPARYFVSVHAREALDEALAFAKERQLPVFVLGGGSNILVADEGFSGLVLHMQTSAVTVRVESGAVLFTADAGVDWDAFVSQVVSEGLTGVECLAGIPGTIGGAVVANLGAYGAECSDTFVSAEVLDLEDLSAGVQVYANADCDFSYHDSFFSKHPGRFVIVTATFSFARAGTTRPSYRDNRFNLASLVAEHGREPTVAEVRDAVIKVRAEKGVLRTSYRSAGSFFHMPFVSAAEHAYITERAQALDADKEQRLRPWAWEQAYGTVKVAPGFLLEYTPFQKGYAEGAVGISPKHTLSVITSDGATAHDVATLAQAMHDEVKKIFNISLEREVKYIGAVEK